ncbi:MAG: ABC transporter permease [Microthrixaceae bacterium]
MTTDVGVPVRPSMGAAFKALLLRDLTVLRKTRREFVPRTVLQPMLLVFVFTYVFPKIGQGIGGGGISNEVFSTLLIAGVVATSIMFQGIQAVALPLVQEFGFTREIEDRVLAPLPVAWVAIEKIVAGALQCLLAGLIVFPIAAFIPATPISLSMNWPVAVVVIPLACLMASSLGLTFGTIFEPRNVPVLFGVIVVPMTFLGCVYYTWDSLEPIRWLQIATLLNPLVYMSEGARAALTDVPHMSLWAVIPAMVAFTAAFAWIGITNFVKRVID